MFLNKIFKGVSAFVVRQGWTEEDANVDITD